MRTRSAELIVVGGAVAGVRSADRVHSSRRGLLLRVAGGDGVVGQGEATPLPGYSRDTFDTAKGLLQAIDWALVPEPEPGLTGVALLDLVSRALPHVVGSARFAVETALLDVLGQRTGRPLWSLLTERMMPAEVPLSAFVGGAADAGVLDALRHAVDRGFETVKLKVNGPRIESQFELLAKARGAAHETRLRLDANQTLDPETARADLERLAVLKPELIEEPVATDALSSLLDPPIPLALDETLQDPGAWERLIPDLARLGCVAVVLKPTALGGLGRCLELAKDASARGLDVTISHTFDGPVALAASSHLALAIASRSRASGLAMHGGLDAWPHVAVPVVHETRLVADDRPGLGLPLFSVPS